MNKVVELLFSEEPSSKKELHAELERIRHACPSRATRGLGGATQNLAGGQQNPQNLLKRKASALNQAPIPTNPVNQNPNPSLPTNSLQPPQKKVKK